jgi:hypothetical protein
MLLACCGFAERPVEPPATGFSVAPHVWTVEALACQNSFSAAC